MAHRAGYTWIMFAVFIAVFATQSRFGVEHPLAAWSFFGLNLAVGAFRGWSVRCLLGLPDREPNLWAGRLCHAIQVQAVAWGAFVCFAFWAVYGDDRLETIVLIGVGGFASAGVLVFAFYPALAWLQLLVQVGPTLIWSISAHERYGILLPALVLSFLGFTAMMVKLQHGHLVRGLRTQMLLERQGDDLRRANHLAEEASCARAQFLANMSHEIRTPINGIMGMTELALDTELTAEQRDYLQVANSSARSLLSLINDILDFSKIEAGRVDLESIRFPLCGTIGEVIRPLVIQANQKGLEFVADSAPDLPQFVVGDPTRLGQVLVNLIGNAVKFTEKGEILLRIDVESRTGDDILLHFAVQDTGCGIPEFRRKAIFEAFTQADNSITRKFGGTGLGLSITWRLVEMMGGRLWVESEVGRGSTFHFTVAIKAEAGRDQPPAFRRQIALSGLPVLIVDDHPVNLRRFARMAVCWGMEPHAADGIKAALGCAREAAEPFRLMIVDQRMPGTDGFKTIQRLRGEAPARDAPAILLTSIGDPADQSRCSELGISACVTKPVCPDELLRAALAALNQNLSGARATPEASAVFSCGEGSLTILVAEDNPVNRRVTSRLLEKYGHSVVLVENGKQAVDVVQRQNFDLILMDVQMPELDGCGATAEIRAREREENLPATPIIALTAHAMKGDRERFLSAGMDEYLSKPINGAELQSAIERVTRGYSGDIVSPACTPLIS
jgi:signal transduction histidine kinase/CheY-like chemotaxis protein